MTRARTVLTSLVGLGIVAAAILLVGRGSRTPMGESRDGNAPNEPGSAPASADLSAASAAMDGQLAARPSGGGASGSKSTRAGEATTPVRVIGRVVDDHRRPVAGVSVSARMLDAAVASATSGTDGRFAIDATLTSSQTLASGSLQALDGAGRGAVVAIYHWPPTADLGTVELVPVFPVVVHVTDDGHANKDDLALNHFTIPPAGTLAPPPSQGPTREELTGWQRWVWVGGGLTLITMAFSISVTST